MTAVCLAIFLLFWLLQLFQLLNEVRDKKEIKLFYNKTLRISEVGVKLSAITLLLASSPKNSSSDFTYSSELHVSKLNFFREIYKQWIGVKW